MSRSPRKQKPLLGWQTRRTFTAGLAAGLASAGFSAAALAMPNRWWDKKEDMSLEERREERRRVSEEFRNRLGPQYETNTPFVNQASIDGLGRAVQHYRKIVAAGGWQTFPSNMTMTLNERGAHIEELRRHLYMTGDLQVETRRARLFDATLQEAVARFQLRHGLRITGFVDSRTRNALNVPARDRLRQLETNLIRLQDLMKINKDDRYVLVNVPAFTLQAVQNGTLALSSKVVVGKPDRETPSVTAKIKELNFFPYWRVPESIAHRDLIPQIRKDPGYFTKENFSLLPTWGAKPFEPSQINWFSQDVFKYKFRQDPGHNNALGVVRINMPNKHIVYLHDTPLKQLFNRDFRAFSSGCVRVERVLDLAGWLLGETKDWSPMRVNVAVALGKPEDVKLKKPVTVHFVYLTAWASGNGIVHFRQDIYNRDGTTLQVAEVDGEPVTGTAAITP